MEQITFISNSSVKSNNHIKVLCNSIEGADEIIFCVAYWKIEGIKSIKKQLASVLIVGKNVTVFASLNEFNTTPEALIELHQLESTYPNFSLFICKKSPSIFHPKIYYFRKQDTFTAIIGSANFTEGGFSKNDEASVKITGNVDGKFHLDLMKYLTGIVDQKMTKAGTTELIDAYTKEYQMKHCSRKKRGNTRSPSLSVNRDEIPAV